MKIFNINGETGQSKIILGETIDNLVNYCSGKNTVIITDVNVNSIYGNKFSMFPVIVIGTGEGIKTLSTMEHIYGKFLDLGLDRNSFIIGIGGGIVCDITGFAASTFMRGMSFGFVPTTLLAHVDAAIGGKNGVNFLGYKNIIGTFNQPEFVLCDFNFLKSLPEKELTCGFAEIIKHASIKDISYFQYLEDKYETILSLEPVAIEKIVNDSITIKTDIVNMDEKEKGERKKLNFGHTAGHAIEKIYGLPHGEAISIGMKIASDISVAKGMLSLQEGERLKKLLEKFKLPVNIEINKNDIIDAMKKDKKKNMDYVDFILLETIGNALIYKIKIDEL